MRYDPYWVHGIRPPIEDDYVMSGQKIAQVLNLCDPAPGGYCSEAALEERRSNLAVGDCVMVQHIPEGGFTPQEKVPPERCKAAAKPR